jgi:lysyl-tRNA synthetase class 2
MTQLSIANLLKKTRQYFWNLNFDEVEVPYLNSSLPLEPNLYSFKTQEYYLPTSPEFALKKYLAEHKRDCFSIAHCFRHLESSGPQHKPEFLMLEYYLVNKNLSDLQESLKKYLHQFGNWQFDVLELPKELPANEPDFNQYFLNTIEPNLPKDKAVFITGYPAFLSPLAKRKSDEVTNFSQHSERHQVQAWPEGSEQRKNSVTSQRFELYIHGIEIANGCEENRDAEQIKTAFLKEQSYRQQNNLPLHPISKDFINNCASLPPCSGLGLGLDRLLMIINNKTSL